MCVNACVRVRAYVCACMRAFVCVCVCVCVCVAGGAVFSHESSSFICFFRQKDASFLQSESQCYFCAGMREKEQNQFW